MKSKSTLALLTIGFGLLAGCSDNQSSRAYSVAELLADEPLLQKLFDECQNNPGEIGDTPRCVNAFQANHRMKINKALENLRK
ncbi:EexN family lipoprotein [Brucella pseudogrignonensis]|uniref:EexN family lipoprotein n=1 Tax=Brucella pseudogrignonensis TaxID=419475 RepID=UPI0038D03891